MPEAKPATVSEVYRFFSDNKSNGYTMSQFSAEWKQFSEAERDQIKVGIGNGTFDYAV
jgi:hypothetical protein